jgi:hypothetical protein
MGQRLSREDAMHAIQLIEVEDSLGIILTDDMLARLNVGLGDHVHCVDTAQGFALRSMKSLIVLHFATKEFVQSPIADARE